MARAHRNGSLRNKVKRSPRYPKIHVDSKAGFASIKLAPGLEAESFTKDGFVFCKNEAGEIIEIQVLHLDTQSRSKRSRRSLAE